MRICIETIPHDHQLYDTVGNYFTDPIGIRQIRVSEMGNADYEFLVALHELIESHLCQKRGISDESIDAFDKQFEEHRKLGVHSDDEEPGGHPDAPYYREHQFASIIEILMAYELGVDWNDYGATVLSL
jgi:hypothetical protein